MSIAEPVKKDIRELEALRGQIRFWSLGSFVATVAILAIGLGMIYSGVQGLFQQGPIQDQFASALAADVNRNVVPSVQTIASDALRESQPAVEAQFTKLNTRVPEVSSAFMQQFDLLQKDLPARGDKVLSATFGKTLQDQEPKIRTMFPDATDENVNALVQNVSDEAQGQIQTANDTLFSKHMEALNSVVGDLEKIQNTETVNPDEDKANLEMAISVIDTFHSDLTTMDASQPSATTQAKEKKQ